jgi:hypothetical protein
LLNLNFSKKFVGEHFQPTYDWHAARYAHALSCVSCRVVLNDVTTLGNRYWGPHLLSVVGHTLAVMRHYVSTKRLEVLREAHYPVLILTGTEDRVTQTIALRPTHTSLHLLIIRMAGTHHETWVACCSFSWCGPRIRTCWPDSCEPTSRSWRVATWYAYLFRFIAGWAGSKDDHHSRSSAARTPPDQHRTLPGVQRAATHPLCGT